jgi:hypothetical protein
MNDQQLKKLAARRNALDLRQDGMGQGLQASNRRAKIMNIRSPGQDLCPKVAERRRDEVDILARSCGASPVLQTGIPELKLHASPERMRD